ncbi:hypothetical protein NW752_009929 [Fusarium irregulare]|uniref:DUF7053 domain-containing protein n=1 Tax=Fusarium irregulare TaxID=2494466 RepID=A0A9W8PIU7_9HYPO|nr:hypothetical protein NW752_009929 [Fusarium irregulare]KAJ4008322.1 hypothetical protein NW766_009314 [Fusarium irregulare]
MRTTQLLSISVPVPGTLPPSAVLAALQAVDPFVAHHRTVTKLDEVPADPADTAEDPFFGPFDDTFRAFEMQELVNLAPGLAKTITYRAIFQVIPDGLRSRAKAPVGVVVRAQWQVRQQQRGRSATGPISPAGSDSTASGSTATVEGDEFELHEQVLLEANSLLMPFITESCVAVHREICENFMAATFKEYFGTLPMHHHSS